MQRTKLNLNDLKRMIREELGTLSENDSHIDPDELAAITNATAALLKAIGKFRKDTESKSLMAVTNHVTPEIDQLETKLRHVNNKAAEFTSRPARVTRVSLKAAKDSK